MSSGENTASNGAGLQKSILSAIKNTTSLQDSRESSFEKSKTLTLSSNPKSKFLEEVINPNPESKKLSVITESTNSFVSDLKKENNSKIFKAILGKISTDDSNVSVNETLKNFHRKSSSIDLGSIKGEVIEIKDYLLHENNNQYSSIKKSISLEQVNCATINNEKSLLLSTNDLKTNVAKRSDSLISSIESKDKDSITEIPFTLCSRILYVCVNGEISEIKDLLKDNPNLLNYAYPFCYRYTCLHMAAKSGNTALVRWLVNKGANLNAKDDNWCTPLHLAAQAKDSNMVKLLCELGTDQEILDGRGKSYKSYLILNSNMSMKRNTHFDEKIDLSSNAASSSFSTTLTNSFSRYGSLRVIKRVAKDLFIFPGTKR